jgi:hypothetical protein
LQDKLRSHYDELCGAAQASEDELRHKPAPGEWSALQQVEHQMLAESI